jgi:hypothetical protein
MTSPLSINARIVAELREKLKAEYGLEDGDEALEDTLEGASDLPEILAKLARSAVWHERKAEAMAAIIRDNQERKSSFELRAERTRNAMSWAMQEAGMKKIPADVLPDLTVSMRDGKAPLVIPADELVPHEWCKMKYTPDRAVIREALEVENRALDFAHLGNAKPILTIRSK